MIHFSMVVRFVLLVVVFLILILNSIQFSYNEFGKLVDGDKNENYTGVETSTSSETCDSNSCKFMKMCHHKVLLMGEYSSKFEYCSVKYARPITLCSNCIEFFLLFQQLYSNLLIHKDETGKRCSDYLLFQDRLNVIHEANVSVTSLWNSAYCFNCYENHGFTDNTTFFMFSDDYEEFFSKLMKHKDCVHKVTKNELDVTFLGDVDEKLVNSSKPCEICLKDYTKLNKFYNSLEEKNDYHVCMDIVDTMNMTRNIWTSRYDCHLKYDQDIPVIIIATIVVILPFIFYISIYMTVKSEDQKIVIQKRLNLSASNSVQET